MMNMDMHRPEGGDAHWNELSKIEPNSPDAYTLARHVATSMFKSLESKFKANQESTFAERLAGEFERLVRSFGGSDGANPENWKALIRKLELKASQQIQRQDSLALQKWVG